MNAERAKELAERPAINLHDRSHRCPRCGWLLAAGGFCIHEERGPREILDGVPVTFGVAA